MTIISYVPLPATGTLALVGSGEYLQPMLAVDRALLARLTGPARVVCLPTAAGNEGEQSLSYWDRLGVEHFTSLGVPVSAVRVIDRSSAHDPVLAARIRAANFVYLSGGKPSYLHDTLMNTPAWEAINAVLAEGGVVAGCSAGAMIWGAGLTMLHHGFDRLNGAVIVPHFDEINSRFTWMLKAALSHGGPLLGIEGNTALVLNGGTAHVLGTGGVTMWSTARKERYTDGQAVTWP